MSERGESRRRCPECRGFVPLLHGLQISVEGCVAGGFEPFGGAVVEATVQAAGVVPVDPAGGRPLDVGQVPADRLDRIAFLAALVDERDDQRLRGSSSPTKKTVARR